MKQGFETENRTDEAGNPAGGYISGVGMDIEWQDGPLLPYDTPTVSPDSGDYFEFESELGVRWSNGAFVEDVIDAALQRLEFFQQSKFACDENAEAIRCLRAANEALASRTQRRIGAGVEGSHGVAPGDYQGTVVEIDKDNENYNV